MRSAVSVAPRRFQVSDQSAYWTAGQVCEHFAGVSDMWIRRHQKEQGFPAAIKFGGPTSARFFKIAELLQWERDWITRARSETRNA